MGGEGRPHGMASSAQYRALDSITAGHLARGHRCMRSMAHCWHERLDYTSTASSSLGSGAAFLSCLGSARTTSLAGAEAAAAIDPICRGLRWIGGALPLGRTHC
jgi:hypothetical protein